MVLLVTAEDVAADVAAELSAADSLLTLAAVLDAVAELFLAVSSVAALMLVAVATSSDCFLTRI